MGELNIEDLQKKISAIQKSVEKIRNTGISDKALCVLIQHSAPPLPRGAKLTQKMIMSVIKGMESLEEYVFPTNDPTP